MMQLKRWMDCFLTACSSLGEALAFAASRSS